MSNRTLKKLYDETIAARRVYENRMRLWHPGLTDDQQKAVGDAVQDALEAYQAAESTYLMAKDYLARKKPLA